MNAPKPDVIGWFDDFIRNGPAEAEDEARAVRFAVAELYEAASGPLCSPDFATRTAANVRLAKALLRFEGRES
jgi:hypothetical protein